MEVGKVGKMEKERDFALGDGHIMPCAGDALLSCTLETCMVL